MTSHQCLYIALDYTSWCSCDRPNQKENTILFADIVQAAALGSGIVVFIFIFVELLVLSIFPKNKKACV